MRAAAESGGTERDRAEPGVLPGGRPQAAAAPNRDRAGVRQTDAFPSPPEAFPSPPMEWKTARGVISLDRPRIMAVLNITPDSFWDGGRYDSLTSALERAEALVGAGADLIDVGGESTRPGARAIPAGEESDRVIPVIRELTRQWPDIPVSIDTVKAEVARAATDAGAAVINDVSGLRLDPGLAIVAAAAGAGLVLMHSRGPVERMASYETAVYGEDPVGEITAELHESLERARVHGVPDRCIALDPGLGFSKRTEHSLASLANVDRFLALGRPILLGPSRKRFVGEVAGGLPPEDRLEGTIAACVAGLLGGARIFRVHDVAPVKRALAVADAVNVHSRSERP